MKRKTELHNIYLAIGLAMGIVLAGAWGAGIEGEGLIVLGLAGLAGMGTWHSLRVVKRNRRMAAALRTAMHSGVIGEDRGDSYS
jgi:hypothetical protein